jgi:Short C-terminal domain
VDFKGQEVDFQEADRRYADLKRQRDAGTISEEEFETQRQRLMVLDGEGRWWAKSRDTGEWRYHDGSAWVQGSPPGYEEDVSGAKSTPPEPPPAPASAGGRRRRMPLWIPVVGLGGLALIGIVIVGWVLLPDVRSEILPEILGGQASGEVAFDAAFVHSATAENITANSTYLDNPLINGDPDAIVYVTPNWNPEGSAGKYDNHPIGVWYDTRRKKWAIFNQDRAAMPKGADFNVGIIKEAKQE